jgi:hypothetical protein
MGRLGPNPDTEHGLENDPIPTLLVYVKTSIFLQDLCPNSKFQEKLGREIYLL